MRTICLYRDTTLIGEPCGIRELCRSASQAHRLAALQLEGLCSRVIYSWEAWLLHSLCSSQGIRKCSTCQRAVSAHHAVPHDDTAGVVATSCPTSWVRLLAYMSDTSTFGSQLASPPTDGVSGLRFSPTNDLLLACSWDGVSIQAQNILSFAVTTRSISTYLTRVTLAVSQAIRCPP